ncbi:MAG: hypothetical protein WC584_01895 [Candidatus Pacearchaeota archaeon]
MRKIISKEEFQKKKKRNQLIVGLILIGVMIFGTLGYAFEGRENEESKSNKINYNGFEFVNQNDYWTTKIGELEFIFKFNPEQVDKIEGNFNSLNKYSQKPMYIYSENEMASFEIVRNMGSDVQRIQKACFEEKDCGENLPLKTCKDNFIIIKESETKKVEQKENCVFIEGNKEDLIKLSDEFLFKILGIN